MSVLLYSVRQKVGSRGGSALLRHQLTKHTKVLPAQIYSKGFRDKSYTSRMDVPAIHPMPDSLSKKNCLRLIEPLHKQKALRARSYLKGFGSKS